MYAKRNEPMHEIVCKYISLLTFLTLLSLHGLLVLYHQIFLC